MFFVDDSRAMCEFTYAGVVAGDAAAYIDAHPETKAILDAMRKVEGSVLTATYWALLPFRAGGRSSSIGWSPRGRRRMCPAAPAATWPPISSAV